uniref:Uncharacterized protein n=1 Tax=Anguilla anguilla TaxID=7936 RepID=A0A0E9Q9B6_ANGAN
MSLLLHDLFPISKREHTATLSTAAKSKLFVKIAKRQNYRENK